jgi:hypothetical protein
VDRQLPGAPLQRGETTVRGDLVQPRSDVAALVECADAAPGPDQALLYRVLGVVQRPQHPVAVRQQLAAVRRDHPLEGVGVTRADGVEQLGGRGHGPSIARGDEFAARPGLYR